MEIFNIFNATQHTTQGPFFSLDEAHEAMTVVLSADDEYIIWTMGHSRSGSGLPVEAGRYRSARSGECGLNDDGRVTRHAGHHIRPGRHSASHQ